MTEELIAPSCHRATLPSLDPAGDPAGDPAVQISLSTCRYPEMPAALQPVLDALEREQRESLRADLAQN